MVPFAFTQSEFGTAGGKLADDAEAAETTQPSWSSKGSTSSKPESNEHTADAKQPKADVDVKESRKDKESKSHKHKHDHDHKHKDHDHHKHDKSTSVEGMCSSPYW